MKNSWREILILVCFVLDIRMFLILLLFPLYWLSNICFSELRWSFFSVRFDTYRFCLFSDSRFYNSWIGCFWEFWLDLWCNYLECHLSSFNTFVSEVIVGTYVINIGGGFVSLLLFVSSFYTGILSVSVRVS